MAQTSDGDRTDARADRLKAALKANMSRRKTQKRTRAENACAASNETSAKREDDPNG